MPLTLDNANSAFSVAVYKKLQKQITPLSERLNALEEVTHLIEATPGPMGDKGIKGDKGVKGDVGAQGPKGSTGLQGPQGDKGDVGAKGEQGIKGDKGDIGAEGIQGSQGEKGDDGAKGDIGSQGEKGIQGDVGPQGIQGETGLQGDQGIQGAQGKQGLRGIQGETGPSGSQGEKGDQGKTGEQGLRGIQGETGPNGIQGEKGDSGKDAELPDINKLIEPLFVKAKDELDSYVVKTDKDFKNWKSVVNTQLSTIGGGGEVWFKYLNDVNRGTLTPNNDNWVLEYDVNTKKVQFTEDIGPVRTIKLNNAGPIIDPVPGMLAWNTDEDCLNIYQNDGSVNQVGIESYIRVHNDTTTPLLNGEVVKFTGVVPGGFGVPTAELMTGDENQDPLFIIGVLTNDIEPQGTGRATTLGYVRGLDTTGFAVGETWQIGDMLWVHPTLPGKMTKVKPTAPNLSISVAAVMIVDATEGVILVRPIFGPRLSYGTFLNTGDHIAPAINTPTNIPIDTTLKARGFALTGVEDSRITCTTSGLYNFAVSYDITSTNAASKEIYFWLRRNGVDVEYTTRRKTIAGNGSYESFACTWSVSMLADDYVQLMWAATATNVILEAPPATTFAPQAASVLLTITEAAL